MTFSKCLRFGMACGIVALISQPIAAQTEKQQRDWCENQDRVYSADQMIAGCTALMKSDTAGALLPAIYYSRGYAYGSKGDYDRAISDFTEAIRLDPKHADTYGMRGITYAAKRDYDRAIVDFNEEIRLDPKSASAYQGRGDAYQAKGDLNRAKADHDLAAALAAAQADPAGPKSTYSDKVAAQREAVCKNTPLKQQCEKDFRDAEVMAILADVNDDLVKTEDAKGERKSAEKLRALFKSEQKKLKEKLDQLTARYSKR